MTLTVGSVCSGIAAPETAWAPLGWDFLWSADIEPFPNTVRAARFQGVPNLGDMTAIAARVLAGEVAAPDVLVGGTPCQSFSVAGLRGGLSDERGNLALEFIRLADAIDAVRRAAGKPPAWILWENVPGVLSDAGNAFGAFLGGLGGCDAPLVPRGRWTDAGVVHGPGRCAAWRILDAQFHGLAQRRERVFVLARGGAGGWACADALLPIIEGVRWHPAPRREAGKDAARPIAAGAPGGSGYRNDADTADNLVTAWGGNNTSGAIDVAAALNACPTASGRQDFESETFLLEVATTLRARDSAKGVDSDCTDTLIAHTLTAARGAACANAADMETYIPVAHTLEATAGRSRGAGTPIGMLAAVAAEPIPFDTTQLTSKANRSNPKAGDPRHPLATQAHPPAVAFTRSEQANSFAWERDVYPTLNAQVPNDTSNIQQGVRLGMAVRRLTPRECERLQGFPDDWTQVQHRAKPAADGPRYRALGNSMAVPVLVWIGRRIEAMSR